MNVKIGDQLRVVDNECNSFQLGEMVMATEICTESTFMCLGTSRFSGRIISQVMIEDEVVLYTPTAVVQTAPALTVPIPKIVASDEMEIAQKLGDIYGVWFEGQLVDVMDTREEAREVKFNLGGKARGAFIIQYGIIKEVR